MWSAIKALFQRPRGSEGSPPQRVEDSPLPFPLLRVPGSRTLPAELARYRSENVTPIIMGAREDVRLLEELRGEDTPATIIERAAQIDVAAWMAARIAEEEGSYYAPPPGQWQDGLAQAALSLHLQPLSRRPKPQVLIGLVPTGEAWQIPAFVSCGGWNECPPAEVHVAFHRKWQAQFGAEITCLSSDIIECRVSRPPTTRDEALALAREQFVYCPDIVHQGCESIEALAATLLGARVWFFWWD